MPKQERESQNEDKLAAFIESLGEESTEVLSANLEREKENLEQFKKRGHNEGETKAMIEAMEAELERRKEQGEK